jgi:hypothetical protein
LNSQNRILQKLLAPAQEEICLIQLSFGGDVFDKRKELPVYLAGVVFLP